MGVDSTSSLTVATAVKPMAPHIDCDLGSFLAALAQAIWITIDFLNEKFAFMNEIELLIRFVARDYPKSPGAVVSCLIGSGLPHSE